MITVAELIELLSKQDQTLLVEVQIWDSQSDTYDFPDVQRRMHKSPTTGYVCLVAR